MRLRQFRVRGFRCIHDTGNVSVADTAALIGKNESGKTAILEALAHLNKDLPIEAQDICDDLVDRLKDEDRIVEGRFELSESEKSMISEELPDITIYEVVLFRRKHPSFLDYEFPNAKFPRKHSLTERGVEPFKASLAAFNSILPTPISLTFTDEPDASKAEANRTALKKRFEELLNRLQSFETFEYRKTEPLLKQLVSLVGQNFRGMRPVMTALDAIKKAFRGLFVMADYPAPVKSLISEKLRPRLLYFPEYKVIDGIIDVAQYLQAKDAPRSRSDVGYQFQKTETVRNLFHLAQLDPKQLDKLIANPSRLRSELVRSSQRLTSMLSLTWKGKKIDVRLDFSNGILTAEVADIYPDGTSKNRGLLDRRSSGFKWHFSFFVNFRAGIQQTAFKDAILLLDEPGLNLHPEQQAGLVDVIRDLSQTNQVLYTTHSPFMIYNFDTGSLLTVEFDPDSKASRIQKNFWEGDWQTIRPILHSIGDSMLLKVFKGADVLAAILVVEGITDERYLVALAEFDLSEHEDSRLGGAEPIPSGGHVAVKDRALHYRKRKKKVVALFDNDPDALAHATELENRGFPKAAIVRIDVGKHEADIEDIFTEDDYLKLVNTFYGARLRDAKDFSTITKHDLEKARTGDNRLRIVKALEKIFASHATDGWGAFNKAAVCNFFCDSLTNGDWKLSSKSKERFEKLFSQIRAALEQTERPKKRERR